MIPTDRYYTPTHQWVQTEGSIATIGITDYAQQQLGDIIFIEFPALEKEVAKDTECVVVESIKAASEIQAPLNGRVVETNTLLDTKPELMVRRALRSLGHTGYRLDRRDLPGRPDIAFIGRKKAIFVHGCFWHGHDCKRGARMPKTNADYWRGKIARNVARDAASEAALAEMGWDVLTIWECKLKV